jgi:hypothetical protein
VAGKAKRLLVRKGIKTKSVLVSQQDYSSVEQASADGIGGSPGFGSS